MRPTPQRNSPSTATRECRQETTGRRTVDRRLRVSGRHGRANGDIKQHGREIKGVVER